MPGAKSEISVTAETSEVCVRTSTEEVLVAAGDSAAPGDSAAGSSEQDPGTAPAVPAADARAPWWPGALLPVGIWIGSRAALIGMVLLVGYLLGTPPAARIPGGDGWVLERFVWWDSFHFLRIADLGYLPPGLECCDQAFFPGYPLGIRMFTPLTGRSEWASLLVTLVFGTVAAVLLWRIAIDRARAAGDPTPQRAGLVAVSFLAVAPYGIFLSAAYSEAMFLAFALGAWRMGLQRRWWWVGVMLAGATAVRINGVFLTAALAVMYLGQLRSEQRWRPRPDVLALGAPALVIGAYFSYLFHRTGSWTAWQDAEAMGWHRQNAWLWRGIALSWDSLRTAPAPDVVVSRTADLLTVLAGLVLVVVLLVLRRWPDATYLGLNVGVVAFSTLYVSAPRYALTCFPVYLLVTDLAQRPRWRWLAPVLIVACLPLEVALALAFSAHLWVA